MGHMPSRFLRKQTQITLANLITLNDDANVYNMYFIDTILALWSQSVTVNGT